MKLLSGRKVADVILQEVQREIAKLKKKGHALKLSVIFVGNDPASLAYVGQKKKACEKVGIVYDEISIDAKKTTTKSLIALVQKLNADKTVTGFLVQLPLPKHVYTPDVLKAVDPYKDVDGFHAYNLGKMLISAEFEDLAPSTARGIIRLFEEYKIFPAGKEVVVVGRSNIVGKPISVMMLNRDATVTVCHSKTKNLAAHTRRADILIVAIGKPKFIKADMVKKGAVVVDVGINRVHGGLCGDVDFDSVSKKVKAITPVPGGVGPLTVACLMDNVVRAFQKQHPYAIGSERKQALQSRIFSRSLS